MTTDTKKIIDAIRSEGSAIIGFMIFIWVLSAIPNMVTYLWAPTVRDLESTTYVVLEVDRNRCLWMRTDRVLIQSPAGERVWLGDVQSLDGPCVAGDVMQVREDKARCTSFVEPSDIPSNLPET